MSAATAIVNSARWEWFRLRRRAAFWSTLGLLAVVVAGATLVAAVLQNVADGGLVIPARGFPLLVFEALSRLSPFLGVVLAAIVFGGDFGWGTFRPLLARGQARWQAALVKLLLPSIILAVAWIAAWTVSALVGLLAGGEPSAGVGVFPPDAAGSWADTAGRFFSAWPVAVAYLGLAAFLCALGRSTAFGLGIGIAIVLAEAIAYPIAGAVAEPAWGFSIAEYTRWTLWGATNGLMGRDNDLGAWLFLPAAAAYLALFWGLTLTLVSRQDVGSG